MHTSPHQIGLAHPALAPPLGRRASVLHDLREVFHDLVAYRELLVELTRRDLRIRYKQAVMGVAWAVLTPLVVALSGWIIRVAISAMTNVPIERAEMAGIAVKAIGWSFFIGALGFATASITANLSIVTKVYFPREALPISTVLTQIVDSAIGASVVVLVLPFFSVPFTAALLWVPLLVLLLIALTVGAALVTSAANVFFRDAKHVVQLITSFGLFLTPVFFNAAAFGPRGVTVLMANPLGPILEGMRLAIVHGHNLMIPITNAAGVLTWSPYYLAWSIACAVFGTAAAAVVFHRSARAFAEYV